jgi:hypothetical protein
MVYPRSQTVTPTGLVRLDRAWKIRAVYIAIIVLCGGLVPVGLWIAVRVTSLFTPAAPGFSNGEVVTILLAGLTVSIAVLALVVAGLAVWGYHAIQEEARKVARKHAHQSAINTVKSKEIQERLRAEARTIIGDEFAKWKESQELAASQPQQPASKLVTGTEGEKVGKPYKRKTKEG